MYEKYFIYNKSKVSKNEFNVENGEVVYQDLKLKNLSPVIINSNGNIISKKNCQVPSFFDYYDKIIDHVMHKVKHPFLIIEAEGSFTHLKNIRYTNKTVQYLNAVGLHIYFRELPYIGFKNNHIHMPGDLITIRNEESLSDQWNEYKSTLFGFEHHLNNTLDLFCYEFNVIDEFVKRNLLTNVYVHTGLYNSKKYLQHRYKSFNIDTHDIFIPMCVKGTDSYQTIFTYNKNIAVPPKEYITYKFLSTNRRYEGIREILVGYLFDRSSKLSYHYKNIDFGVKIADQYIDTKKWDFFWNNFDNRLWTNVKEFDADTQLKIKNSLEKIKNIEVLSIDKPITDKNFHKWLDLGDQYLMTDPLPFDHYRECFCYIISESLFAYPFGHFADKTITSIKCFRPFILLSTPHTLEYMKKLGFKTFNDFWDESYDAEEDHKIRFKKILELIDYIDQLTIEQCQDIYEKMIPILEHNHKMLNNFSFKKFKPID